MSIYIYKLLFHLSMCIVYNDSIHCMELFTTTIHHLFLDTSFPVHPPPPAASWQWRDVLPLHGLITCLYDTFGLGVGSGSSWDSPSTFDWWRLWPFLVQHPYHCPEFFKTWSLWDPWHNNIAHSGSLNPHCQAQSFPGDHCSVLLGGYLADGIKGC